MTEQGQSMRAKQMQMVTEKRRSERGCRQQKIKRKLPSVRIELTTLGLLDPRSNQLSYEGICTRIGYHGS